MSKPEVLMIGPYPPWDMDDLDARYIVHRLWEAADRDGMIDANRGPIRAIATGGELGASAELMKRLPALEIVSCYGGIKVTNTPDVLTADGADMAVGLLLPIARKIPQADQFVREGNWAKGNMPLVTQISGKPAGVVGMGRVGAAVAKRLAAFDCEVAYFDIDKRVDLAYEFVPALIELARRAEFLIVTLAGGESTKGIINASVLEALGRDGILVNVSRGSTVDETALLHALEAKTIKGAGLDVFWNEPHIDTRFRALDNVVLQPHHASGTTETRRARGKLVRDNLAAHFSGTTLITPIL